MKTRLVLQQCLSCCGKSSSSYRNQSYLFNNLIHKNSLLQSSSLTLNYNNRNLREFHYSSRNLIRVAPSSSESLEVVNKKTILHEIDQVLGKTKAPAFEYIYVEPSIFTPVFWDSDSSVNPYGHGAIRYNHPETGESIMMNSM